MLRSLTIIVDFAISPLSFISFCFAYFAALLFGTYPLVPNKTVLTSDATWTLGGPLATWISVNWLQILGFPWYLGFNNFLELRKSLYLQFLCYYKEYKSGPVIWRDSLLGPGRVLDAELPWPLPVKSGYITLWHIRCLLQPGSSTECWCPEFLLGFRNILIILHPTS